MFILFQNDCIITKRITNFVKTTTVGTQENIENRMHYIKHQMQTKNWRSKQCTPKSKIAN